MPRAPIHVDNMDVSVYTLRTEQPESDGTLEWDKTVLAFIEIEAGGQRGLGYTYASEATGRFIAENLADVIMGRDAMDVAGAYRDMRAAVRNLGQAGIAAMAISAVDTALWDLKAKLVDLPLCVLLGKLRDEAPIYGSGGFTSYSVEQLQMQLSGWTARGIRRVKMKVGRNPDEDLRRVHAARQAIGDNELFVDANGAYTRKQAIEFADQFAELGVRWFEEPVSSDDLEGLRQIRERAPMVVAAGEYGYDLTYYERMIAAAAVDVIQADVTRCGGISGFLKIAALCEAHHIPLSAHCAPAITLHAALAAPSLAHIEYFHDHIRFEQRLFADLPSPDGGTLRPDLTRPGHGLELKEREEGEILFEAERPPAH